jgi:hypothetical protein
VLQLAATKRYDARIGSALSCNVTRALVCAGVLKRTPRSAPEDVDKRVLQF